VKLAIVLPLILLVAACRVGSAEPPAPQSVQKKPRLVEPASEPELRQVVTLGDSLAFGEGDETGLGLAGQLDRAFVQIGLEVEPTLNLGRNGSTTSDVALRLQNPEVRQALREADVIVLSIGANDLGRSRELREAAYRAPLLVADQMLERVAGTVQTIRALAPSSRILILGGYNPFKSSPRKGQIDRYLMLWDAGLTARFESDKRIEVVTMSDLVEDETRLSSRDRFHPGQQAYEELATRIAGMLNKAG
jgi:lysophospholipase L1-like esterase